jgi:hypothetical protein
MSAMARVWIEEGCIQCGWCQNLEPRVFSVSELGCLILADVRQDGLSDDNRAQRVELRAEALDEDAVNYLPFIAGGCPAEVIQLADIAALDDPLMARSG